MPVLFCVGGSLRAKQQTYTDGDETNTENEPSVETTGPHSHALARLEMISLLHQVILGAHRWKMHQSSRRLRLQPAPVRLLQITAKTITIRESHKSGLAQPRSSQNPRICKNPNKLLKEIESELRAFSVFFDIRSVWWETV